MANLSDMNSSADKTDYREDQFRNKSIKSSPSAQVVGIFCVLNIVSSIVIVLINKIIYTEFEFPNITLTCIHFAMTSLGLLFCHQLGLFQPKRLPILQMLPLAFTFCGFVVFTNLSLQTNTVGTYQLIKSMTTPCIMLIQTLYFKKSFSTKVKMTVIPIATGVYLNSYYDVKFNVTGIIFASIGVLVTSQYQVWVGEKQQQFQVNAMQLLYYQAPLSALLLLFVIPWVEPLPNLIQKLHVLPFHGYVYIIASGAVAFLVNLFIYWMIGNTSAVTYNMVGHLKFCLTILGGFILFHETPQILQILGMLTTLIGVIAYTHSKMQENKEVEIVQLPTTSKA